MTWRSYNGDRLIPLNTAFEGRLYEGRLKTRESRNAIPIPEDVIPIIEAWRSVSKNTAPDALMFSHLRSWHKEGRSGATSGTDLPQMENPSHRRQAGYSKETRDLSSDAPNARHRHAGARDHEGRATDITARQHQNHSRDIHAGNPSQRALGHQLTHAGDFQPA